MDSEAQFHPLEMMEAVEMNLRILHLRPEAVRPLRLTEVRQFRELLNRSKQRICDLLDDLEGGRR